MRVQEAPCSATGALRRSRLVRPRAGVRAPRPRRARRPQRGRYVSESRVLAPSESAVTPSPWLKAESAPTRNSGETVAAVREGLREAGATVEARRLHDAMSISGHSERCGQRRATRLPEAAPRGLGRSGGGGLRRWAAAFEATDGAMQHSGGTAGANAGASLPDRYRSARMRRRIASRQRAPTVRVDGATTDTRCMRPQPCSVG
jgi:hypothetical protein